MLALPPSVRALPPSRTSLALAPFHAAAEEIAPGNRNEQARLVKCAAEARLAGFRRRSPLAADEALSEVLYSVARWQAEGVPLRPMLVRAWCLAGFAERLHYRKRERRAQRQARLSDEAAGGRCPVAEVSLKEEVDRALQAVSRLPERLRVVVLGVRVNGSPRAEMARQLGCSLAHVDRALGEAKRLMLAPAV